jgi:hypothetical protein
VGVKRLAFVLCLAATGCGGQAMQGVPGGAKSESELGSTIEASAAEMERELASLEVAKKPAESGGDQDQAGAVAGAEEKPAAEASEPPAAPPPADAEATTSTNEPEEVDERERKRDGCKIACKALASMKRTEARICELVGESHDKCTWAHERVKEAVQRIERAQCSCKD